MRDEDAKVPPGEESAMNHASPPAFTPPFATDAKFLEAVFDAITDGLSIVDADLTILKANAVVNGLFAHAQPLVGKKCYEAYHGSDQPCDYCPCIRALREGTPQVEEIVAAGPAGTRQWLELHAYPLSDDSGKMVGAIEYIRDVSDRKKMENALRESEEHCRSVLESLPLGIHTYRLEPDGHLIFTGANSAADRILNPLIPDREGRTIEEVFPQALETDFPQRLRVLGTRGGCIEIEQVRSDGLGITEALEVFAFRSSPASIVVAFQDVTFRKKAEEALRESEEKFRSLSDQSLQGIGISRGFPPRLVFANPALADMLGYTAEELLSLTAQQVTLLAHRDDRPILLERLMKRLSGEPVSARNEFRLIRKDGSVCWVESFTNEVKFQGASALRAVFIDVTERKTATETLRASEARFRALAESTASAIFITRPEGIMYVNPAFSDLTGYSAEEVSSMIFRDIIHPDHYAEAQAMAKALRRRARCSPARGIQNQHPKRGTPLGGLHRNPDRNRRRVRPFGHRIQHHGSQTGHGRPHSERVASEPRPGHCPDSELGAQRRNRRRVLVGRALPASGV